MQHSSATCVTHFSETWLVITMQPTHETYETWLWNKSNISLFFLVSMHIMLDFGVTNVWCHRTDQFIRAQVQKQSPKWSNSWTWAHINPVVNWNIEGFQTNLHTTKITVIQYNISYVIIFRRRSQIDYIITESSLLQNQSCKTCGSK